MRSILNNDTSHKRHILRSTSIIGGATAAGLVIGMIKMKLIAALMGPSGVGLLGLFTTLLGLGFAVIGMAIDTSGVRLLSASANAAGRAWTSRWALWSFAVPLALFAAIAFWLLQEPIARLALGDSHYASRVRWIGFGVAATIISGAQIAIVQSARRMADYARIKLWSALLAASVSLLAIYLYAISGLIIAILAAPVATMLVAFYYRRNLPRLERGPVPGFTLLRAEWTLLATLGIAVTLTALVGSASQIVVRAIIVQHIGLRDAGLFQASIAISSLNLGLILGAMIADYYPRLSEAATDSAAVNRILNQQIHVGLMLAAPALLGISTAAPLLLSLLYTSEFTDAALLLRLQVAADAMRVAGWALGFVLLARGATIGYFLVEAALSTTFGFVTWMMASRVGVEAAGIGYLLGYVASLSVALAFAARHGVHLSRSNAVWLGALLLILLSVAALSLVNGWLPVLVGILGVTVTAYLSLKEIVRIGFPRLPRRLADFLRRRLGWQEGA